jgi:hypothetical protein
MLFASIIQFIHSQNCANLSTRISTHLSIKGAALVVSDSADIINLQLALRMVAISIVHYQVYIYLGHQVSNATIHYRFCQVGMD